MYHARLYTPLSGLSILWKAAAYGHHEIAAPGGGGCGEREPPRQAGDWAKLLPAETCCVLFEEATEAPGSSPLNNEARDGTYVCAACFHPLFDSQTKYTSGTGWPSFWQALPEAIATKTDYTLLLPRTEYHCARCSGHQGHVFDDGPPPTGLRYCNNGLALNFIPRETPLPEERG